jgi:hypothetical protein
VVLQLCHRCSSDYIIMQAMLTCSALVDPLLSFLSGSSRCTFRAVGPAWLRIALDWRGPLNSRSFTTASS